VFGNAFPAKIAPTFRTPSHSLSLLVIITSLKGQIFHNISVSAGLILKSLYLNHLNLFVSYFELGCYFLEAKRPDIPIIEELQIENR
jgi:hypothetical protein